LPAFSKRGWSFDRASDVIRNRLNRVWIAGFDYLSDWRAGALRETDGRDGGVRGVPFNDFTFRVFQRAAARIGVRNYEIDGAHGPIIVPVFDRIIGLMYLRSRVYSDELVGLIASVFATAAGGTFFDVGANLGLITIPVARNSAVDCFAFEPDPRNFRSLRRNIHENAPGGNVSLINAAAGARAGEMKFATSDHNSGDHRLSESGEITVSVIRLDDYPAVRLPLVAKIDTQGAEPLVIAGGSTVLAKAALIVMEFWPWGMSRMQSDPQIVIDFIAAHFPCLRVLRHGALVGDYRGEPEIRAKLNEVLTHQGEGDFVDLVLSKVLLAD
jgi:FkbM family methyltransferase